MCGRWAVSFSAENLEERYGASLPGGRLRPSYNIAPTATVPTVTRNSPNRIIMMRWGLIPFWAKDEKIGYRLINARAESVRQKPAFRRSFASARCLVPASGFYEWQKREREKVPFYIRLRDTEIFSFAGLYDVWQDPQGREVTSFTIITTAPNKVVEPVHNRMPVVLEREDEDVWLDKVTPAEKLQSLLRPYARENNMEAYPVSERVNNPLHDSPENIRPA